MPRTCTTPFDREQLDSELQSMLIADAPAILHALHCPVCDSRSLALSALALAGWGEFEFLARLELQDGE